MKSIYFGLDSIGLLHWHTCHNHHHHHRHRHIFTFSSILNKSSPPTPSIVNENQEDDLQPEDFGLGSSVRKTLWCKVDCIDCDDWWFWCKVDEHICKQWCFKVRSLPHMPGALDSYKEEAARVSLVFIAIATISNRIHPTGQLFF